MALSRNLGLALSLFPYTTVSCPQILSLPSFLHRLLLLFFSLLVPLPAKRTLSCSQLALRQAELTAGRGGAEPCCPPVPGCTHSCRLHLSPMQKISSLGPAAPQCSCLGSSWGLKGNGLLCGVKSNHGQREGDSLFGHFVSFWEGC